MAGLAPAVPAAAAPPASDDFDTATIVADLPFVDRLDTSEATVAADDPAVTGRDCLGGITSTVWYRFIAPRSRTYVLDTIPSTYDTVVAVYTGQRGALELAECSGYFDGHLRGHLLLAAEAGATYHVMVGASELGAPGGRLVFALERSTVEPLDVTFELEARAHLAPNGEVVLAGSVTCSRDAEVGLDGAVGQGVTSSFFFPQPFACGPEPTPFRAATRERSGERFALGPVDALVIAYGYDRYDRYTPEVETALEVIPGRIVFARSTGTFDDPAATEIFSMEADGSDVVRLTGNAVEDAFPAISPDGTRVAFARLRDGGYDLLVVDALGGSRRRVTRTPRVGEALPAWSPDGGALAYTVTLETRSGFQSDLFWVPVGGGSPVRLTHTRRASEFAPEWSPDGRLIAFTKWDPVRERYGIAALDLATGGVCWLAINPLSTGGYTDANPTWSPDGQWVAFAREHGADPFVDVFKVRRDGTGLVPVTRLSELSENPTWGPDGRIAFQHEEGVAIVAADGSGLAHVTPTLTGLPFHWPDW